MGKNKGNSRVKRVIKAPFRVLACLRNLYIRSLTECAGRMSHSSVMVCPTAQLSTLPKNFGVNSAKSDQDISDLIRVASLMSLSANIESDPPRQSPATGTYVVPRSVSVGIGRIDEDEACEFGDDFKVNTDEFSRSRSYAVRRRTAPAF